MILKNKKQIKPVKYSDENSEYLTQLHELYGTDMIIENNEKSSINQIKKIDLGKFEEFDYLNQDFYRIINSGVKLNQVIMTPEIDNQVDEILKEFNNKQLLSKFNLKPDNKLLFFGPSGCGKTLLAHALANELKKKLFIVNLSTIIDSGLGKTSNKIAQVFNLASTQKGILFFDEIDMLGKKRDDINDHGELKRIATSILQELDFMDHEMIFIAATNFPDLVDGALLRRFNRKIEFKLPGTIEIEKYIKVILNEIGIAYSATVGSKIQKHFKSVSYAEFRDKFISTIKKFIIQNGDIKKLGLEYISYLENKKDQL